MEHLREEGHDYLEFMNTIKYPTSLSHNYGLLKITLIKDEI